MTRRMNAIDTLQSLYGPVSEDTRSSAVTTVYLVGAIAHGQAAAGIYCGQNGSRNRGICLKEETSIDNAVLGGIVYILTMIDPHSPLVVYTTSRELIYTMCCSVARQAEQGWSPKTA